MQPIRGLALLPLLAISQGLSAGEVEIARDESIVAVITHKAGFAASRAHNHLIVASDYETSLSFDPAAPLVTQFTLDFAVEQLIVDPWEVEQARYPRLEKLGLLSEPFSEVADKDRQKIRQSMLSGEQLDGKKFPRISAEIAGIVEKSSTLGGVEFPFTAELVLEVHGQRIKKPAAARYDLADGSLRIEAVGAFRFSEFGIEPFSAFFGAVKNEDEFHVYLNLKGTLPSAVE